MLVNSYRPAWGRPRNLDQKLIALLGTGIISHPHLLQRLPLTHLVYLGTYMTYTGTSNKCT